MKYLIYKVNPFGDDYVVASCNKRIEIPYELEVLGFKDYKTKLDENGTLIYYKGRHNAVYVAYNHGGKVDVF